MQTGKKKKGLGGGNCQVSTTLYNAILNAPSLVITERHSHSNKVPYIQNGKDAAVATGSYDLKFKNNSGKKIKIKASCSQNDITIKLLQLYLINFPYMFSSIFVFLSIICIKLIWRFFYEINC